MLFLLPAGQFLQMRKVLIGFHIDFSCHFNLVWDASEAVLIDSIGWCSVWLLPAVMWSPLLEKLDCSHQNRLFYFHTCTARCRSSSISTPTFSMLDYHMLAHHMLDYCILEPFVRFTLDLPYGCLKLSERNYHILSVICAALMLDLGKTGGALQTECDFP